MCEQPEARACRAAIPVIVLSALNVFEGWLRGFRAGAVDCISKPFQVEEYTRVWSLT